MGTRTAGEYLAFARDCAFVDFAGHQANDFQVTDEAWSEITTAIQDLHQPNEFVTFLGYEWSGLTPAGGDRNVYFAGDEAELCRSGNWQVSATDAPGPSTTR